MAWTLEITLRSRHRPRQKQCKTGSMGKGAARGAGAATVEQPTARKRDGGEEKEEERCKRKGHAFLHSASVKGL